MRFRLLITLSFVLLAVMATSLACTAMPRPVGPPSFRVSGEIEIFYDRLTPFGDWVWLEVYGWTWIPHDRPAAWRPYTYGHWVRTGHGWTWVSDWSWGWAPFHYGRWLYHHEFGWVWIPGREWAPAWVAWRYGPSWVGWAPLPPEARWRAGVGLDLDGVTLELGWWSFVGSEHFLSRQLRPRLIPGSRDLFDGTREVTRYESGDRGVVERGVPVEEIERETRQVVPRLRIEDLKRPSRRAKPIDDDRLRVYRPKPSRSKGEAQSGEAKSGKDDGDKRTVRRRPPPGHS